MSADHPIRWIAGAAVAIGLFAIAAVCSNGPPRALDLKVASHSVVYAETHTQAVAIASKPVAPRDIKVASKPAPARKQRIAKAQLPEMPRPASIVAAGAVVASTAWQGGFALVRAPTSQKNASPILQSNTVTGAQVTAPPRTDVLLAARPLRGPPA